MRFKNQVIDGLTQAQNIGQKLQFQVNRGMSQEEIDRINNEVKKENRDGKIDALIDGKDFKEIKPEEHPDWKPGPVGSLMYMDFKYGTQNEEKTEDESPIKGRRGPRKKKN